MRLYSFWGNELVSSFSREIIDIIESEIITRQIFEEIKRNGH